MYTLYGRLSCLVFISVISARGDLKKETEYSVSGAPIGVDLRVSIIPESAETKEHRTTRVLVAVDNRGSAVANNINLSMPLPVLSISSVTAISEQGVCVVGTNAIFCTITLIPFGEIAAMFIEFVPDEEGMLVLDAMVTSAEQDLNLANNVRQKSIVVRRRDHGPHWTPAGPSISDLDWAGGVLTAYWQSVSNVSYHLDWSHDLAAGVWTPITNLIGTGSTVSYDLPTSEEIHALVRIRTAPTAIPPPPEPPVRIGSWGHRIKVSEASWDDDAEKTRTALEDTCQNFIVFGVGKNDDWRNLLALLDELGGTDIRVFASLNVKDLKLRWTKASQNIDGVPCGDLSSVWDLFADVSLTDCDSCEVHADYLQEHQCRADCFETYLDAWKQAARCLSQLSCTYTNLRGLILDDYNVVAESVDKPALLFGDRLTRNQLSELRASVRECNSDFELWVSGDENNVGRFIAEGFVLGSNYGVRLYDEELMQVELSIDIPPYFGFFNAQLEFFHHDSITGCKAEDIFKEVYINGTDVWDRVWSEPMLGNQDYQKFNASVSSRLVPGMNTIYLHLDPVSAGGGQVHQGCGSIFWYVWGLTLRYAYSPSPPTIIPPPPDEMLAWGRATTDDFIQRFHTNVSSMTYAWSPGCQGTPTSLSSVANSDYRYGCESLPDGAISGRAARRLISAPNQPYRITDLVDGVVNLVYKTDTYAGPASCTSGGDIFTYEPWGYDTAVFRDYLSAVQSELAGGELMSFHLGVPLPNTPVIDETIQSDQLITASGIADYTGLWTMPIGLEFLDTQEGVFADRNTGAIHLFDGLPYAFRAYFPGRQSHVPGWYQRWVSEPSLEGRTVEITVDHSNESDSGMIQRVIHGSTLVYDEDLTDNLGPWSTTLTVTDTHPLTLSMVVTGADWHNAASAYFHVTDTADSTVYGALSGHWTYETGVDSDLVPVYENQVDTFQTIRTDCP
jgi:hypothetical protein